MTTEIEKTWNLNINGYTFTIQRNKRKDCFLGLITNTNNTDYIERIQPIKRVFLTLKGAKKHALEMINEYEVFFSLQESNKNCKQTS